MKSLITKIIGACLGLSLATGVGVGIATGHKEIKEAKAADATMNAGTNASPCTVNGKEGIKAGTSSKGGDMTITVGAGATSLSFYAAAWKGVSGLSLNLTGATAGTASFALTADSGISNSSPFTLSGNEADFKFTTSLSNITKETTITLAGSIAKRFVVWSASYETGVAPTLSSLSLSGDMTKTSYLTTDSWNPTGLTATATYDNSSTADVTDDVTWSYNPATPSSTSTTSVTVTASYTEGEVEKTASKNVAVTISEPVQTGKFSLYYGSLTEGDYVIYYNDRVLEASVGSAKRFGYALITPTDDQIINPDPSLIWHIAPNGNYWTLYNESVSAYAAGNGTSNQGALVDEIDDHALWSTTGPITFEFVNKYNSDNGVNANLRNNHNSSTEYGFATYSTSTGGALSLYKAGEKRAIVNQRVAGYVSANNHSVDWNKSTLKFEVQYEDASEFVNVTRFSTFVVNTALPAFIETTTIQVSVTGTYNKDTSITDTRNVDGYLNYVELDQTTIERLYYEDTGVLDGYFYGYFMGYSKRSIKSNVYTYDLYVGNGDYAIYVYGGIDEEPSSYVPFETPLKISGGYLTYFSNLLELSSYVNSTDYEINVEVLTDEAEIEKIAAVTTYMMTGTEVGSDVETKRTASRLAAVAGEVTELSGPFASNRETTFKIKLDDGNIVTCYVAKYNYYLDFATLNNSVVVGNRVVLKGFTSIHGDNYQLVQPTVVEVPNPYTSVEFANDLISLTASICAAKQEGNAKPLSKVWATLQTEKFVCLIASEKEVLRNVVANENGTTVENAMARYDLICVKYGLTNFIGRESAEQTNSKLFALGNLDNTQITVVVVCAMVAMTSAAAFLLLKKKKHN